jgi:hypothetical protein
VRFKISTFLIRFSLWHPAPILRLPRGPQASVDVSSLVYEKILVEICVPRSWDKEQMCISHSKSQCDTYFSLSMFVFYLWVYLSSIYLSICLLLYLTQRDLSLYLLNCERLIFSDCLM